MLNLELFLILLVIQVSRLCFHFSSQLFVKVSIFLQNGSQMHRSVVKQCNIQEVDKWKQRFFYVFHIVQCVSHTQIVQMAMQSALCHVFLIFFLSNVCYGTQMKRLLGNASFRLRLIVISQVVCE